MIESPCVNICTLDARSGMCLDCGRSIDEIARWTAMSAAERASVMKELSSRLTTIKSHQNKAAVAKTATG
jgi:uncharacterized protein